MTATLHHPRRAARLAPTAPRPVIARAQHTGAPDAIDYTMRRIAVAALAVVVFALLAFGASAAIGALADVGARPAVASDDAAAPAPLVRVHVAQPGDTLWSIADRYRGDVGQARFVDALVDLNGGTVIQVGQAVRLP